MSWLPRSRALNPDQHHTDARSSSSSSAAAAADDGGVSPPNRGVKEDLSELTETLTRQFWSAASFLAPPPPPPPASPPPPVPSCAIRPLRRLPAAAGPGIRSDFVEIGGTLRSGISKIASNFLAAGSDTEEEEDGDEEETYSVRAVGLTDEVLTFARNISMHPETWLDFPLYYDFEDCQDFDMSDAQQEHALAVEHLLPRLAALRIELCPNHMTDGCFWKIYFVLLHSRLNKHDAELLSTRHIVEAKSMLLQRLQSQMKEELDSANRSYNNAYESLDTPEANFDWEFRSGQALAAERIPHFRPSTEFVMEKDRLAATEMVNIIDKPFVAEKPSTSVGISVRNYVDDHEGDAWLEEQSRALHDSGTPDIHLIDEDVSFSDLEDDDDCSMPTGYKAMIQSSSSQTDARECPLLNKSVNYTHTKNIGTNYLLDPDDEFDTFMGQ